MDFDAVITGDRRIVARFGEWPEELHDTLLARIRALTSELEARVRALAPSRTDKLKEEIISKVFDDPEKIKGLVTLEGGLPGSEYAKAAALEYGAPGRGGAFKVRAYRRTIQQAFGRDISPTSIDVSAYSRIANIDAHLYLRGGLAGTEADAVTQLQAVIDQSTKAFNDDA
ncbi:MAG: hypothetical protein KGI37_06660 [Alphaproteobacteria bacterium]|nr:hypothetical protein [Alphaproteobacteria bacterium]